jgi:hypothetical protein
VLANLEADAHLLYVVATLIFAIFLVLLSLLVAKLAPVENLNHRRARVGRDLHQVKTGCGGLLQSGGNRNYSNLFAFSANQPNLGCGDLLVQASFGCSYC